MLSSVRMPYDALRAAYGATFETLRPSSDSAESLSSFAASEILCARHWSAKLVY